MASAAMLLGAGYGTRLRPLTGLVPKPLVPVGLRPLLDRHISLLSSLGVTRAALNASHLADQLVAHVASSSPENVEIDVLVEERPLGIGGGLLGARRLLEREDRFLVLNTDVFHTIDLDSVMRSHDGRGADATLVVRRADAGEPADELTVDGDGVVTGVPGMGMPASGWKFAGIHVLTPGIFEYLDPAGAIFPAYRRLLAHGARVVAHVCEDVTWVDVGTPAGYLEANRMTAGSGALVAPSAKVGRGCVVGPGTVIGEGARIGAGARLTEAVVWPRTAVPPGAVLERAVAYPGGILRVPGSR